MIRKLPCKNCLTLVLCRKKHYLNLISECPLFYDYLIRCKNSRIHKRRCKKIERYLQPTQWKFAEELPERYLIEEKEKNDYGYL